MSLPWIEKYRPTKLDEIISQEESIHILNNTLKTGELPHLLIYGGPGTGKTSSILALCIQLFGDVVEKRVIEDGKYPNYEAVIPKEFTNEIYVDFTKFVLFMFM